MGERILLAGIFLYAGSAYATLRFFKDRLRSFVFGSLNVYALVIPLVYFEGSFNTAAAIAAVYFGIVCLQYYVTRHSRPWIAILAPIVFLGVCRYYSDARLVGISYMAFRLSYVAVELANDPTLVADFWEYVGFAFFAPTLMVGPIAPYRQYATSFRANRPGDRGVLLPVMRITVGATKYLFFGSLLSRLSYDSLYVNELPHPPIDLVVASVAYYLYLYCNFSGFCDMAIGVAQLLGIELPENFNNPFASRNIKDFWNRWHITLSGYVRNLTFTPLTKWLVAKFGPKSINLSIAFSILVVFLIIGVWHGTGWNYALFGLFHGAGMIVHHYYGVFLKSVLKPAQFKRYQESVVIRVIGMTLTFAFVCASFFLFANDMTRMKFLIRQSFFV